MSDQTLFTDDGPSDLELDGLEARLTAAKSGRPLLPIQSGKQPRPQRVVIYGVEGIGKSTLASAFPRPLYLDTEDGTSHLDVDRVAIKDWRQLMDALRILYRDQMGYQTAVIDTADQAEQMCIDYVCKRDRKGSLEDWGYGRGYTYLAEEYKRLLKAGDALVAKGLHVVIVAHAQIRKIELPDEAGAFDKYELKLSKKVAPLVREWCDMLLFCNYRTFVTEVGGTKKAQGADRVMYTTHAATWDAKNRVGLAECLPLNFESIKEAF